MEEYKKMGKIKASTDNILYTSSEAKSIFSIDSDGSGKLLLASVYENVFIILIKLKFF